MGSKSGISICSLWKAHTKTVNNSISLKIYLLIHFSNYLPQIFRIRSLHDYKKDQLSNQQLLFDKLSSNTETLADLLGEDMPDLTIKLESEAKSDEEDLENNEEGEEDNTK